MHRRTIIASYWLVVFLALPLWWYTTSIVRLALPTARVTFHAQNSLRLPVRLHFENSPVDLQPLLDAKGLHVNLDSGISDATYTVRDHPQTSISGRILRCPPSNAADILASLLAPSSSSTDSEQRVVQYSPRYRLAFSLLNEDAAAGSPVLGWEITNAIQRYLSPILDQLSPLHNFTIESQVQFHAPLAFKPSELPDGTFGLTQEQLTVFVNSAEWSLSSSASNDPVLHFVLFVPSLNRSPLRILNPDNTPSSSNAFLLPQWGTILLYNAEHRNTKLSLSDLEPVFKSFAAQLLTLLGAPRLPPNVARSPTETAILTDWQLDALMRRRALENAERAKDTLHSIVKLVDEIQNMPVGKDVRNDVVNALNELDEMYALSNVSLKDTLCHSAQALALASRAFFNPGMLPLLYFPAEHKYAVYTPLFASAMIPMVVTALREFKAWRKERRAQS
ncbi:phosphatidylinositol-glycan biosynthesis class S protein-domain-containing protein [Amanita rubescens]|nr:phosphatidylinositol-glycan biosynthesis class S protein-domain-containing protein [Amanita rubescens]